MNIVLCAENEKIDILRMQIGEGKGMVVGKKMEEE